ncbi:MAG: ferredoxin--NADP reductase [Salinisphaera sp.]|uniref:ferredoxin--NADP reductase n=1 Tax=Salinisphaera sp. TaxID=1914330 RepID=UPI003C79BE64
MAALNTERVTSVKHWNDSLFSFTTTRDHSLRFENGQFVMIGLPTESGKPLLRAYSIVSANYEEYLEFFSIKVPDGPLTSRLQHLKVDDEVFVSTKPTGTLLITDLHPGRNLYLLSTGTGLAPFLSIVRDPETYERFERVIVVHGVRYIEDLAYDELLAHDLPNDAILGELIHGRLFYYPVVSREEFRNHGRLTTLLDNGRMTEDLGLEPLDPERDRAMICGSPSMLDDTAKLLDDRGFTVSPHIGKPGEYVIERAFVAK